MKAGTDSGGFSLAGFILAVTAVAVFAARFEPGQWYSALVKPPLTPPDIVFPIAWAGLYLMIAVSGWLAWRAATGLDRTGAAFIAYAVQLILNASWSWLFFGTQSAVAGLVNIGLLIVAIIMTLLCFYRISRAAAIMLLPYLAWVLFAFYLNAGIIWLN